MTEARTEPQSPAPKPQSEHQHRRHRSHGSKPKSLRTQVMRHVVSFAVLFVFFLFSAWKQSGVESNTSDWSVIFYVVFGGVVYGISYILYPIVHRAWADSKK